MLANPAKDLINWTDSENLNGDGELFTLSFVIAENAAAGNYQVTLVQKDGKPGNFINEDETPISVTFAPGSVTVISNPFGDVAESDYFYEPVLWAVGYRPRIASGTSAATFSPNLACTRAQVVTFLWRAHGTPEPSNTVSGFADVPAGCYYDKAVRWAVECGITSGTSSTSFSPNQPCTRAQMVTFLWRAAGSPATEVTASGFQDVKTGSYYEKAVLWAVENEITKGTSENSFSPNTVCSRGQVVTFLYRSMVPSENR